MTWIFDPFFGSQFVQNTSPRRMSAVIFDIRLQACLHQKIRIWVLIAKVLRYWYRYYCEWAANKSVALDTCILKKTLFLFIRWWLIPRRWKQRPTWTSKVSWIVRKQPLCSHHPRSNLWGRKQRLTIYGCWKYWRNKKILEHPSNWIFWNWWNNYLTTGGAEHTSSQTA